MQQYDLQLISEQRREEGREIREGGERREIGERERQEVEKEEKKEGGEREWGQERECVKCLHVIMSVSALLLLQLMMETKGMEVFPFFLFLSLLR